MTDVEASQPAAWFGWWRAKAAGLTFRRITDEDLPLLKRVYASTREDELAPLPWSDEQKAAFVDMQFRAQHSHYRRHHADMDWLVILRADEPIGRLYLERGEHEHSIVDIAFLSEQRGQGLGTALLSDVLDDAAAAGKPMTIYVEKFNPAMALYLRLGFTKVEEHGVYDLMRRAPP
jgi:ribosomal protein S18 acetylase RimI-like enzyme